MYYFYGYFQAKKHALANGQPWDGTVHFCVPSGNFGNALACYYARAMGAPISKIVVATNANDILHRCAGLALAPRAGDLAFLLRSSVLGSETRGYRNMGVRFPLALLP